MAQFFFIHIPKTGGTSFRQMLQTQFKPDEIFPNENLIRKLKGYPYLNELNEIYQDKISNVSLLVGHYPLSAYQLLSNDVKLLTFFREPVSRAVSFIRYYKKTNQDYKNSSLEEIFNSEINQLSNMQVKIISSIFNDNNKNRINVAIENLNRLDFFGISEDFNTSIKIAEKQFCWNLGVIKKVNITNSSIDIPENLINQIIECNQEDIALYNVVKSNFLIQKQKYLYNENHENSI